MFVSLLITILTLLCVRFYLKRRRVYSQLASFPIAKGWPVIGILFEFMDDKNSVAGVLKYQTLLGRNFVLPIGPTIALFLQNPQEIEFLLGSHTMINKSSEYNLVKCWFGDGLLTSKGYKWKSHRKILTPAFHYNILQDFIKIFNKSSRKLVGKFEEKCCSREIDIFKPLSLHTLDIICETAMGIELNTQDDCNAEFVTRIKEMCDIAYERCFSMYLRNDFIYQFTPTFRRQEKALKILKTFSENIITKRRQVLLQNGKVDQREDRVFGMKSKNTFLDILLLATVDNRALTDEEIREEVDTFIFEGHDTTAAAVSFAFYSLSKHSEVQEKAYQEIKEVFGDDLSKEADYESLQSLKYLEMVIKETLRLYPSVGSFGRTLDEDIKYGDVTIPKDITLAICPYALHRNPEIYPDPEKFDPERFSAESQAKRHPYAYVPFSAGPRNCIGQKYAMLEMKSTIVEMLRSFVLLPAEGDVNVISKLTLQSTNGIKLILKKRE